MLWTKGLCPFLNSHIEALTPNVAAMFGDRAPVDVNKFKRDYEGGV